VPENRYVLASVDDPDGRSVVLTLDGWVHILNGHPELAQWQALLVEAIGSPDYRAPDPIRGRYRYWLKDKGPSGWLRVVVDFLVRPAEIVTAFPERKDPAGWQP
jgi:hypothetical protein